MRDNIILNKTYGGIFVQKLLNEIIQVSKVVEFKEGDVLIDYNKYIKIIPLLMSGAIKVMR